MDQSQNVEFAPVENRHHEEPLSKQDLALESSTPSPNTHVNKWKFGYWAVACLIGMWTFPLSTYNIKYFINFRTSCPSLHLSAPSKPFEKPLLIFLCTLVPA